MYIYIYVYICICDYICIYICVYIHNIYTYIHVNYVILDLFIFVRFVVSLHCSLRRPTCNLPRGYSRAE